MENLIDSTLSKNNVEIDSYGLKHLIETRKWTMFLSIAGFTFLGIMILIVLFAGSFVGASSAFSPITALLPLLLICVLYFFPIYYLLKFSKYSKQAIVNLSTSSLTTALRYLKMHYRYIGILFIVMTGIYLIFGLVMLLSRNLFF